MLLSAALAGVVLAPSAVFAWHAPRRQRAPAVISPIYSNVAIPDGVVGLISRQTERAGSRTRVTTESCTGFAVQTRWGTQIATARHCVEHGGRMTVYDASRRGMASAAVAPRGGPDVALVQMERGTNWPVATVADSSELIPGDPVCAWRVRRDGRRMYWDRSCSRFLGRRILDFGGGPHEVLLIERALSPGFSGGPVLDMSGRVVGVGVANGPMFDIVEPVEHVAELAMNESTMSTLASRSAHAARGSIRSPQPSRVATPWQIWPPPFGWFPDYE